MVKNGLKWVKFVLLSRITLCRDYALFLTLFFEKIYFFLQILDIIDVILGDIICPTSKSHGCIINWNHKTTNWLSSHYTGGLCQPEPWGSGHLWRCWGPVLWVWQEYDIGWSLCRLPVLHQVQVWKSGGCSSLSEYDKLATHFVIQVQQLLRKGNVLACVNLPPCYQHHPCLHPWHPPHPRAGDALRLWLCHNIW